VCAVVWNRWSRAEELAWKMEKMTVLAPVPSAITATMMAVVALWRAKYRNAKRTSPASASSQRAPRERGKSTF
jgi:hypothetical protein